jgi:hypothetical protein
MAVDVEFHSITGLEPQTLANLLWNSDLSLACQGARGYGIHIPYIIATSLPWRNRANQAARAIVSQ